MKRDDAINTLFELFKVCKNNQHRYEVAAAACSDSHLAALLEHYALRREQFALHLADVARIMGAYPDTSSGMSPTQASIQFDLESPLKPEDEWAALVACERGETQALRCYLDALGFDLPKHVLHILEHQYEQTGITYVYISDLRSTVSGFVHTVKKLAGKDDAGNHEDTPEPSLSNGQKP